MEQNEKPPTQPQDSGLTFPFPGTTFPTRIGLPINIMADDTNYYLLTRDKIESLKAGTDSDESTLFGVCVGVFVAIASILIPLYISVKPESRETNLIGLLWVALGASALFSIYFFRKWRKLRQEREKQFKDILEKYKTVVTLDPASQSSLRSQDSSQKLGSTPNS
jgi:hypothetical protein